MRPASAISVLDKPRQESADDRDARLESAYTYERMGERSTMAFVSVYRDDLVAAFFEWREREYQLGKTTGEGIFDGLFRWEVSRFGSRLDKGPHGLLLFWVRCKLAPEHGGRVISPGYFDRTPRAKALPSGGPEVAAGRLARGMVMPHGGKSRQATDERLMELEQQAAPMRGPTA